jgi:hypothetical protein
MHPRCRRFSFPHLVPVTQGLFRGIVSWRAGAGGTLRPLQRILLTPLGSGKAEGKSGCPGIPAPRWAPPERACGGATRPTTPWVSYLPRMEHSITTQRPFTRCPQLGSIRLSTAESWEPSGSSLSAAVAVGDPSGLSLAVASGPTLISQKLPRPSVRFESKTVGRTRAGTAFRTLF